MKYFSSAMNEIRKLSQLHAKPRLIPFSFSSGPEPRLIFHDSLVCPGQFAPGTNPVFFIHGVDYASEQEAAEDFLVPLAEAVKLADSRKASEFYLLSWNSLLFCAETRASLGGCALRRVIFFLGAFFWWGVFWRDAERRATDAAKFLSRFVARCLESDSIPLAVTHSAGGLVWARTVQNLIDLKVTSGSRSMGRWWNLQPALPAKAFCAGGEFSEVAELYTGHRPVHLLAYSRADFILGALYRLACRVPAMGQFGSKSRNLKQRDLTWTAFEAHGRNVLTNRMGSFFVRAKHALRVDARKVGLV